jgi:mannose-6-phosphate isomerase-like protein (cupin superfamily)
VFTCLKLPLAFDPAPLRAEVEALPPQAWTAHYNTRDYDGDWDGVALRSPAGMDGWLFPDMTGQRPYADTPTLGRLTACAAVLSALKAPLQMARLLRLRAGSSIREHSDDDLCFEQGLARLHVPVITDPAVIFRLDGEVVPMAPGSCWYINANRPHSVDNRADIDRVHLVVDVEVNPWLAGLIDVVPAA